MDTENFLVKRTIIEHRLAERRARDLSELRSPTLGMLPGLSRLAFGLAQNGGMITRLLGVALPLVVPFLFRKQTSFLSRIVNLFSRTVA